MKKEEIDVIVLMIRNLGIENEVREALSSNSEKPLLQKEKTSNGYRIYYNEANGEAVGIVYKNLVFLKETSKKRMTWSDAVKYCEMVVINGITSQLCPVGEEFRKEFKRDSREIYQALAEIGAKNLAYPIWGEAQNYRRYAWTLSFGNGCIDVDSMFISFNYVRAVLILQEI